MRIALLGDNKIAITFLYNPRLVLLVKTLPAREYNPIMRAWLVPLNRARQAIGMLTPFGFTCEPDIIPAIERLELGQEAIAEIKKSGGEIISPLPLRKYQQAGFSFAEKVGSVLIGDEQGVGKTLQAIAVIRNFFSKCRTSENPRLGQVKILVLCPAILKWQWKQEIDKYITSTPSVVVEGAGRARATLWHGPSPIIIANYELLLRDKIPLAWDIIIADEATRISNPYSKTHRALMGLKADRRIALTGTPVSNTPTEIFGIFNFIQPGYLGNNFQNFKDRYCNYDYFGGIASYKNLDELRDLIDVYIIRRTREEVLPELPAKTMIEIPLEFSDEERKLYEQIREELLLDIKSQDIAKLDNPMTLQQTLVKLLRLQELTDSMELLGDSHKSTKVEAIKEILGKTNDKVLIYTRFSRMADILERELAEYHPLKITGDVKDREPIIKKFNSPNDSKILVMTDAASMGLNLQYECSTLILVDLPLSIAKFEQVIGRLYRMGQLRPVFVYQLLIRKSIDYKIKKILEKKRELSEKILKTKDIMDLINYE